MLRNYAARKFSRAADVVNDAVYVMSLISRNFWRLLLMRRKEYKLNTTLG